MQIVVSAALIGRPTAGRGNVVEAPVNGLDNGYAQKNLVASRVGYSPSFAADPALIDAWRIVINGEHTTGEVFNQSLTQFFIAQAHPQGAITGSSKFIFATDNGTQSAWTERKNAGRTFDRPDVALKVVDPAADGTRF
jgi:hypothetical protein